MSSYVHCLELCLCALLIVSSKKFNFTQGYPSFFFTRRWTERREMNAILVAREARDEGKKDLERVNREVERVNREVERVNREVERR